MGYTSKICLSCLHILGRKLKKFMCFEESQLMYGMLCLVIFLTLFIGFVGPPLVWYMGITSLVKPLSKLPAVCVCVC